MNRAWHEAFLQWTDGRRSPGLLFFGALARPVSWLYHLGAVLDERFRYPGAIPRQGQARLVVLSSPLVGGVGKSPLAAMLAAGLSAGRAETHLVTLGYGRASAGDITLDDQTPSLPVATVGDEALMLHQITGCPVHVGSDPAEVIARLDRNPACRWIILDDGVRRRWQNECRIVVFSSRDLERPVRFLPYGRWRTRPQRAWPAAAVVVVIDPRENRPSPGEASTSQETVMPPMPRRGAVHQGMLRRWGFDGPIGWYRPVTRGFAAIGSSATDSAPPDNQPFLFCGLGMPSRFEAQAAGMGLSAQGMQRFPDHYAYSKADIARLAEQCRQSGARWLLTTHKDAVKIAPDWIGDRPIYYLRISLELVAGEDMLSVIMESCQ